MGRAKVTPALDPSYMPPQALDFDKCEFHSEVFLIDSIGNGNAKYKELMGKLFPYDPQSDLMLNPMGNAITKSWTKEGDLMIHVEWVEMIRDKPENKEADNHEF